MFAWFVVFVLLVLAALVGAFRWALGAVSAPGVGVCRGRLVGSPAARLRWRLVLVSLGLFGFVPVVRVSGFVVLSVSLVWAPRAVWGAWLSSLLAR